MSTREPYDQERIVRQTEIHDQPTDVIRTREVVESNAPVYQAQPVGPRLRRRGRRRATRAYDYSATPSARMSRSTTSSNDAPCSIASPASSGS